MANRFQFNGQSSEDFAMKVEKYPSRKGAARKYTAVSIPGRNGDLHIDDGCYENSPQTYECYFHGNVPTPEQAHAISGWLCSAAGYQRLEDTYDPDYFRMAMYAGPFDVENHLNRYGRCKVTFDCKPQHFLKSGENAVSFSSPGSLHNATAFPAKPLITVYGSGSGTVMVGGTVVEIKSMTDHIVLDCEILNAYRQIGEGAVENMNGSIYAPEFPELLPGDNAIRWTGGVTGVDIIPRWWTL